MRISYAVLRTKAKGRAGRAEARIQESEVRSQESEARSKKLRRKTKRAGGKSRSQESGVRSQKESKRGATRAPLVLAADCQLRTVDSVPTRWSALLQTKRAGIRQLTDPAPTVCLGCQSKIANRQLNNPGDPSGDGLRSKYDLSKGEAACTSRKRKTPPRWAGFFNLIPATTDSPTQLPAQYHGPWRA